MEYLTDSSSDSESDHEDVQYGADIQDYPSYTQDYPELSLVDDVRTSLHIPDRGGQLQAHTIG